MLFAHFFSLALLLVNTSLHASDVSSAPPEFCGKVLAPVGLSLSRAVLSAEQRDALVQNMREVLVAARSNIVDGRQRMTVSLAPADELLKEIQAHPDMNISLDELNAEPIEQGLKTLSKTFAPAPKPNLAIRTIGRVPRLGKFVTSSIEDHREHKLGQKSSKDILENVIQTFTTRRNQLLVDNESFESEKDHLIGVIGHLNQQIPRLELMVETINEFIAQSEDSAEVKKIVAGELVYPTMQRLGELQEQLETAFNTYEIVGDKIQTNLYAMTHANSALRQITRIMPTLVKIGAATARTDAVLADAALIRTTMSHMIKQTGAQHLRSTKEAIKQGDSSTISSQAMQQFGVQVQTAHRLLTENRTRRVEQARARIQARRDSLVQAQARFTENQRMLQLRSSMDPTRLLSDDSQP